MGSPSKSWLLLRAPPLLSSSSLIFPSSLIPEILEQVNTVEKCHIFNPLLFCVSVLVECGGEKATYVYYTGHHFYQSFSDTCLQLGHGCRKIICRHCCCLYAVCYSKFAWGVCCLDREEAVIAILASQMSPVRDDQWRVSSQAAPRGDRTQWQMVLGCTRSVLGVRGINSKCEPTWSGPTSLCKELWLVSVAGGGNCLL